MTRHQGSKASSAPYKQHFEGVPRVLHRGMRIVCAWPIGMRLAHGRAKLFPENKPWLSAVAARRNSDEQNTEKGHTAE